jgi:hypothetical protein
MLTGLKYLSALFRDLTPQHNAQHAITYACRNGETASVWRDNRDCIAAVGRCYGAD